MGVFYRRQFAFADIDLTLHDLHPEGAALRFRRDVEPDSGKGVSADCSRDTAFVAYFGHLIGYDAGYYGYAWADAIAADMATVFEMGQGRISRQAGRHAPAARIYEPGDSRDITQSIEKVPGPQTVAPAVPEEDRDRRRQEGGIGSLEGKQMRAGARRG